VGSARVAARSAASASTLRPEWWADRQHKLATLVSSSTRLFDFNGIVSGRVAKAASSSTVPCESLLNVAI
jgi:hypothetical protein